MKGKMIAVCGLECFACPIYKASVGDVEAAELLVGWWKGEGWLKDDEGVDEVLARFGGRRLSDAPDALGSLPVETTCAGIHALAECDGVSAVLEDQPIRRVK